MGGCGSKPKDLNIGASEPLPNENPASPKKPEAKTVTQENTGGETKEEEHLVDLSEEALRTEPTEAKPLSKERKPSESSEVTVKPTEEKIEGAIETEEPAKEEEKKQVGEEPKVEVDASPSSQDNKSGDPLVIV